VIKDEMQSLRASANVPLPLPPPPPHAIVPAADSPFARRSQRNGAPNREASESDDPPRDYALQAAQDRINKMAQQVVIVVPSS